MKISKILLQNFKYFEDLTIVLPKEADVVLLVGPNGVGKSCIFEAIHNFVRPGKKGSDDRDKAYFSKDGTNDYLVEIHDQDDKLMSFNFGGNKPIKIYGRTAYRFTQDITRKNISQAAGEHVKTDNNSPNRFTDLDKRIEDDIEAALGLYMSEVQKKGLKTDDIIAAVIDPINKSLKKILGEDGIQLVAIQNPFDGRGSAKIDLLFSKNGSEFLYKNLSSGEKEVFDIIFNFYRRADDHISDGIYYIDEPELHINTSIQCHLFTELVRICRIHKTQLWVATHSIGFLKEAVKKPENVFILELSSSLSSGVQILKPLKITWKKWQEMLKTPLDDLASLVLPKKIIYCEGATDKVGFDESVYNKIFAYQFPEILFVSSGGSSEPMSSALLAALVFSKISSNNELLILKDRDSKTETQRENWLLENPRHRMLERREIENYLFDYEVLQKLNPNISQIEYDKIVSDIETEKMKPLRQKLKNKFGNKDENLDSFMLRLADNVSGTKVFEELKSVVS